MTTETLGNSMTLCFPSNALVRPILYRYQESNTSLSLSVSVSLSLVENIVLAYPPHHIFVILSVSYEFNCLTLPKPFCYCPFGMRSLIKLFKPNTSGKTWLISTRPNSFLQAPLAWALKQVWVTLSIFLCVLDTELCRGWQTRLKKKTEKASSRQHDTRHSHELHGLKVLLTVIMQSHKSLSQYGFRLASTLELCW